ncbi:MAG: TRAP transporter substrate-binding protein [Rhizobiaceae bacterium]
MSSGDRSHKATPKDIRISRRTLGIAAIGLTATAVFSPYVKPARSAEFTLKLANGYLPQHPLNLQLKTSLEAIAQETNGRVDIKLFPQSQLGADADLISQVRSGALDFYATDGLVMSSLIPVAALSNVPFAFADYAHGWDAVDHGVGEEIHSAFDNVGLHAFDRPYDNGIRHLTTSRKQVSTAQDVQGMKLRVPVSPILVSLFKNLGVTPVPMNVAELYSALQTGLVDGQENPLVVISTLKLNEVQKYCALTGHLWGAIWISANKDRWNSLPSDVKAVISKHINDGAIQQRQASADKAKSLRGELETAGLIFNDPNLDSFRLKLRESGFYTEWREKFGAKAWAALEKYASL